MTARYEKEGDDRQTDEFMTPILVEGDGRVQGSSLVSALCALLRRFVVFCFALFLGQLFGLKLFH